MSADETDDPQILEHVAQYYQRESDHVLEVDQLVHHFPSIIALLRTEVEEKHLNNEADDEADDRKVADVPKRLEIVLNYGYYVFVGRSQVATQEVQSQQRGQRRFSHDHTLLFQTIY